MRQIEPLCLRRPRAGDEDSGTIRTCAARGADRRDQCAGGGRPFRHQRQDGVENAEVLGATGPKAPFRPKLDAFMGVIDAIMAADKERPKKQRHTGKRIFERLRDEHGFTGKVTIVKDYVAGLRRRTQEMFVPLVHPPGHAQADFGEALGVIGGVECKIHYFAFDLPHSDAIFVVAYPAETTEAFCDGHVKAFEYFASLSPTGTAGVPQSILYDNTKIAVASILGDGRRQRTRVFSELQSHYLFTDRFGRPAKGNDKGKVEGLVGFARRNFMVPVPVFADFAALNAHLLETCRERLDERLRGHDGRTIGERLVHDLAAFRPLPAAPYDACEKKTGRVSSLSLVRYRLNDYSVATAYGHQKSGCWRSVGRRSRQRSGGKRRDRRSSGCRAIATRPPAPTSDGRAGSRSNHFLGRRPDCCATASCRNGA